MLNQIVKDFPQMFKGEWPELAKPETWPKVEPLPALTRIQTEALALMNSGYDDEFMAHGVYVKGRLIGLSNVITRGTYHLLFKERPGHHWMTLRQWADGVVA